MIEVARFYTEVEAWEWIDNSEIGKDCVIGRMYGWHIVYHNP